MQCFTRTAYCVYSPHSALIRSMSEAYSGGAVPNWGRAPCLPLEPPLLLCWVGPTGPFRFRPSRNGVVQVPYTRRTLVLFLPVLLCYATTASCSRPPLDEAYNPYIRADGSAALSRVGPADPGWRQHEQSCGHLALSLDYWRSVRP